MKDLGDIQWIFNKTNNISDISVLKTNVIKALKKADGTPIEELQKLFGKEDMFSKKVSKLFGVDIDNAKDLIQALDDEKIFNQIFEIVE